MRSCVGDSEATSGYLKTWRRVHVVIACTLERPAAGSNFDNGLSSPTLKSQRKDQCQQHTDLPAETLRPEGMFAGSFGGKFPYLEKRLTKRRLFFPWILSCLNMVPGNSVAILETKLKTKDGKAE